LNDSLTVIGMPCSGPQRSPRKGGIGGAGAFPRLLELPDNDGIQRGVTPLGARQVEVEQFDAADASIVNFAGADANARSSMSLFSLRRDATA
jgi:hypothetical protein